VFAALDALQARHGDLTVIQGGAWGADNLARLWCCQKKQRDRVMMINMPADWDSHGPAAGPIRNTRMIAEGKPDLVLAFPGGRGTADLVRKAEAAGIPVRRVPTLRRRVESMSETFRIPTVRLPTPEESRAVNLEHYERVGFTYLDQWSPGLTALSMPSKRIELSAADLDAFVGVHDGKGFSPRLGEIAAELDKLLDWREAFVRLNSRSPKDSAYPGLPCTCAGRQAVSWILGSERCFDDMCRFIHSKKPLFIYLREWAYIPEQWELRCFVKDGEMIAATQYHRGVTNEQWQSPKGRAKTWDAVRAFYRDQVKQHVSRDTFVLDLYPGGSGWRVLEINPYGMSDPILFAGGYAEIEAEGGFRIAALPTPSPVDGEAP